MEQTKTPEKLMNISKKTFVSSLLILLALMIAAYVLTFVLPAGEYQVDAGGKIIAGTYAQTEGGIPFWKWLLSPFLVLGAEGSTTIIALCAFLLVLGGAFTALDTCGVMRYILGSIQHRYCDRKYVLLAVVSLFFMALGSLAGSFEEVVPMVPIAVALACGLGWDPLVGLGMSILATCCGFACGVCNVFSVGVAQELAGLEFLSGISFRLLSFVLIYPLLFLFLRLYAKRIEKDPTRSFVYDEQAVARYRSGVTDFHREKNMDRATLAFAIVIGVGILTIISSIFIKPLQSVMLPVVAVVFLVAGTLAVLLSGYGLKNYFRAFGKGAVSFLPALLMILMASAVRYTMEEAKILDTILYGTASWAAGRPSYVVVLLIYALVLVLNFFIGSASAKAFLLIPLIAPLADMCGVSKQVAILAFAYGDGFSNVLYPTNAVLLISLGFAGVGYGKWAKWSLILQVPILILTVLLLLLANAVGYGAI